MNPFPNNNNNEYPNRLGPGPSYQFNKNGKLLNPPSLLEQFGNPMETERSTRLYDPNKQSRFNEPIEPFVPFVPFVPLAPFEPPKPPNPLNPSNPPNPSNPLNPPNPLENIFEPVYDLEHHSVELALDTLKLSKSEFVSMSIEDLKKNYAYSNNHALSILLYWKNKYVNSTMRFIQHK